MEISADKPEIDAIFIDIIHISHAIRPKNPTSENYAEHDFVKKINKHAERYNCIDILCDISNSQSLISFIRSRRNRCPRCRVIKKRKSC